MKLLNFIRFFELNENTTGGIKHFPSKRSCPIFPMLIILVRRSAPPAGEFFQGAYFFRTATAFP